MPKTSEFTIRAGLALAIVGLLLVLSFFQTPSSLSQISQPTGVLRLRVRVKQGEATKGLSRKRFYLVKGTIEQNRTLITAAEQRPIVSMGCFYSRLGASPALIEWLKTGDCESVYCRAIDQEFIVGTKAVPEFATAFAASEKEFGTADAGRKWLTNNLPPQLRDGFYKERRLAFDLLIKQAETSSGSAVLSVMTDRNGTAYFTDLVPGTYVLSSLIPVELSETSVSWNCEVQIKPGDIATEKPYLVSNTKDRNVKCVAVEKPLPSCEK
jgi:hypothetical protein